MIAMSAALIVGLVLLLSGLYLILAYAFRSQLSWAWAIVFLPVVYPVYSILHWTEPKVRNGFLVSVIGFSLLMTAVYGGALRELQALTENVSDEHLQNQLQQLSTKLPQAQPSQNPLPNEAQASAITFPEGEDYDPIYGDDNYTHNTLEPLPPSEDERVNVAKEQIPYAYRKIELSELDTLQGKQLKLITKQGDAKEGKLIDSNDGSLSLEIPFKNGIAAFEYEFNAIAEVLVYDTLEP